MSILATLMMIATSPDIKSTSIAYTGKVSMFELTDKSMRGAALVNAWLETRCEPLPFISKYYCACRWDYGRLQRELGLRNRNETKTALLSKYKVYVNNLKGRILICQPVDWGPARRTGRLIDLSPAALEALDLNTDDEVRIYIGEKT